MAPEAQQRSLGHRSGSILSPESPSHARLASLCRILRCLLTRLRGFDFLVRLFSKPQAVLGGTHAGFENAGFFSRINIGHDCLRDVMVGGGPACPIRNTKWLVSRDQPGASAKGDFSGSVSLRRFFEAAGAISGAFWPEDPHLCIDAQPRSFAAGTRLST